MLASRAFVPLERALERRPAAKKFCWRLPLRKGSAAPQPCHQPSPCRPRLECMSLAVLSLRVAHILHRRAIVQLSFSARAALRVGLVVALAFGLQDACRCVARHVDLRAQHAAARPRRREHARAALPRARRAARDGGDGARLQDARGLRDLRRPRRRRARAARRCPRRSASRSSTARTC